MFIEFADVVELGGNLSNQQLGVRREWDSFVVALVVGVVKVGSGQRRYIVKQFNECGIKHASVKTCLTGFKGSICLLFFILQEKGILLVKPRFLGGEASIMGDRGPLPRIRFHNDPHAVVWDLVW